MSARVVHIHEVGDYAQQIRTAGDLLKQGGLIVLPTETVYGAAADISQPVARQKLRSLRHENEQRPFTIHLAHRDDAAKYLANVSDLGQRMMKKLWPGPVSLIFDVPESRRAEVARRFSADERDLYTGSTITLRCPDHPVTQDVIGQVDGPVALLMVETSRDADGGLRWDHLDERIELIFDAGPTQFSKPSTIVRVRGDSHEIVREGIYDRRIIERLMRTTVLFVCSGNTCRSPMAETLARRIIAQKLNVPSDKLESKGISVISAGSYALPGAKATPQAIDAVRELGGDLSKHRSRPLSVELIHQADVIFTMSRNHARDVIALVPAAAEKTTTLNPEGDIEDPIGGDASLYLELAKQLNKLIEQRLTEKQLA